MSAITQCIEFVNENKVCYFATTENSQPRVRAIGLWFADETGFYFQIGAIKTMYRQLLNNPQVEVCFYKPDTMAGTMLRIAGKIEFLDDPALKEQVMRDRPFLRGMGVTADHPGLIIFRIAHGEAHFWTMENNLKPKEIITF